jgi:hypothetical protein
MAVNTSIDERGVYPVRADGQTTTTLTINVDTIQMSNSSLSYGLANTATNSPGAAVTIPVGGGVVMLATNNTASLPAITAGTLGTEFKFVIDTGATNGTTVLLSASNNISTGSAWTKEIAVNATTKSSIFTLLSVSTANSVYSWAADGFRGI